MAKKNQGYPYRGGVMSQVSEEKPQDPIDQRGPDYDNNTNSNPKERWLTGAVQATKMPHYDNGPKWFFGPKGK
jgi:hypothetical protein